MGPPREKEKIAALLSKKDVEIASLKSAISSHVARAISTNTRLALALDALDAKNRELNVADAANAQLSGRLARYVRKMGNTEREMNVLRDAVEELTKKVEIYNGDFSAWGYSRIMIPKLLAPMNPLPPNVSNLASEPDLWAYAAGMINSLRTALAGECRAHADTRRAVSRLEAQLACVTAELEVCLIHAWPVDVNLDTSDLPPAPQVNDEEFARTNDVLGREVALLTGRLKAARLASRTKADAPQAQVDEEPRPPSRSHGLNSQPHASTSRPRSNSPGRTDRDPDRTSRNKSHTRTRPSSNTRPAPSDAEASQPDPPHRRNSHPNQNAHASGSRPPAHSTTRPSSALPATLPDVDVDLGPDPDPDRTIRPGNAGPAGDAKAMGKGKGKERAKDVHATMDAQIAVLGAQIEAFHLEKQALRAQLHGSRSPSPRSDDRRGREEGRVERRQRQCEDNDRRLDHPREQRQHRRERGDGQHQHDQLRHRPHTPFREAEETQEDVQTAIIDTHQRGHSEHQRAQSRDQPRQRAEAQAQVPADDFLAPPQVHPHPLEDWDGEQSMELLTPLIANIILHGAPAGFPPASFSHPFPPEPSASTHLPPPIGRQNTPIADQNTPPTVRAPPTAEISPLDLTSEHSLPSSPGAQLQLHPPHSQLPPSPPSPGDSEQAVQELMHIAATTARRWGS
ncbi:hypothetical protein B0H17DRAFT_1072296 [Mycena rosella]|uniref:Uncharacterized protein n=1 Tax=Mycena rosella TaxID=1033263 RepID=A0AAD7GFG0_MYCRO|nr:hypothetical protein B0H17DRAFT_1072296 [Mycena rosella]